MSMHLVGPWLSTTGKKKTKRQYRSASAAAMAKKNREAWQQLLVKYDALSINQRQPLVVNRLPTESGPYRRDTGPRIPSVDSGQGSTAAPALKQYTGTLIKGIATMHKSNAVPILDEEQARDVAHMRR